MKRKRRALWTIALLLLGGPTLARDGDKRLQRDVMVPMRDGVRLATDVYLPAGEGPWPAVVRRTPYGKGGPAGEYTSRGFAFVTQDQRGLFRSEGNYVPHVSGIADGYDTIEWVAAQEWSNGKVGISGYSALGIAASLAASAAPPHLEAAFVAVAPESLFSEARFIGGVYKEADSVNWLSARGLSREEIAAHQARVLLDERWLETDFVFRRHNVQVPIYFLGGWYDLFQKGTLDNFRYLQNWGRPGARGNQKVKIGAYGHGSLRGDLRYPDGGHWYDLDEELRWFDYWLRGIPNGVMEEPPVEWYHHAAARVDAPSVKNEWRRAETWPPPGVVPRTLFLQPGSSLRAAKPPVQGAFTEYRFDPGDPVPTFGGLNLTLPQGPMDQRRVGAREDYLRFATKPLERDLEVAGPVTVRLWASSDGPDTDFMVKLVDVYPDGYEALVLDTALRARYRHGRRERDVAFLKPGEPVLLEIDLWHVGMTFERGHRIALHVTSSNWPRFEINPNTGLSPADGGARVAVNRVFHDAQHPSALVLPVLDGKLP